MHVLRTPDERFVGLPNFPYAPRWAHDVPGFEGLRIHYVDEGPPDATVPAPCLHGNPSWSYLYRHMLPVFTRAGVCVIAPDLIGFGRSDKPADAAWHVIRACPAPFDGAEAGHFVPEWGAPIASAALSRFELA